MTAAAVIIFTAAVTAVEIKFQLFAAVRANGVALKQHILIQINLVAAARTGDLIQIIITAALVVFLAVAVKILFQAAEIFINDIKKLRLLVSRLFDVGNFCRHIVKYVYNRGKKLALFRGIVNTKAF